MNVVRRTILCANGILAVTWMLGACGGGGSGSAAKPRDSANTAHASSTQDTNLGGDIPDNQAYVPFSPPDGLFSVKVPEGWARSQTGGATVFANKLNSIRIETQPASASSTVVSATAQELPKIKAAVHGFAGGNVTMVQRKAGQAVQITYHADSAPNPVTGKTVVDAVERYDFWHSGQEVVLTLSSPTGADNADPWKLVTDSVQWLR